MAEFDFPGWVARAGVFTIGIGRLTGGEVRTTTVVLRLSQSLTCRRSNAPSAPPSRTTVVARAFDATASEHWYTIALSTGEMARVAVAQRNLDVVVTTYAPDGRVLDEFDGPIGAHGVEDVAIEATESGTYRLRVKPFERSESGSYEVRVAFIGKNEDPTAVRLERTAASIRESAVAMDVRQPSAELLRAVRHEPPLPTLCDRNRDAADRRITAPGRLRCPHAVL